MKGVDVALNKLLDALRDIEDDEERRKVIRSYFDLVNDAHLNITMKVAKQFPDLHPDNKPLERRKLDDHQ